MKKLAYELKKLCRNSREGGFSTRVKREQVLVLVAGQLEGTLGFRQMTARSLKPKHIESLVSLWAKQNLSTSTIKARMSQLRWWAEKVQKQNVIARSNEHYGIGQRVLVSEDSKACDVNTQIISDIRDPYVKASLQFAREFGLRKEEAIKIKPHQADQKTYISLQASWCKGRRARTVPITTQAQREALDYGKHLAGRGALIPEKLQYHQQRNRYDAVTRAVGLRKLHGLRHRYAQVRYKVLTGWEPPHRGGPRRRDLNGDFKTMDVLARMLISEELGHSRLDIVANYIGR